MKLAYKILKDARYIVATRWLKGTLGVAGGPRCALGAITEATWRDGNIDPSELGRRRTAYKKATRLLGDVVRTRRDVFGRSFSHIADMNDYDKTTQDQMVDAFSEAIRRAR